MTKRDLEQALRDIKRKLNELYSENQCLDELDRIDHEITLAEERLSKLDAERDRWKDRLKEAREHTDEEYRAEKEYLEDERRRIQRYFNDLERKRRKNAEVQS